MNFKQLAIWYSLFNDEFFKGDLPEMREITFKKINNPDYRGDFLGVYWEDNDPDLRIRINFKHPDHKSEFNILETLLHEMFHVYQFINNKELNHGKKFKAFAKRVKKYYGMNIV